MFSHFFEFVRRHAVAISVFVGLILIKIIWVGWGTSVIGDFESERDDILQRRDYLVDKVIVHPRKLIGTMPAAVGWQFQGEWALYSCSMLAEALANIAELYPDCNGEAVENIDSLIAIVKSPDLRFYDRARWGEDPLTSLDGDKSHVSYLSHLAWMIGNYKRVGGHTKYDALYDSVCEAMNRRIVQSPTLNIPTYPDEPIYVPDMMVAVLALADYARQNNGRYAETVNQWVERAQKEWLDEDSGLLASYLDEGGVVDTEVRGSFSALNCYFLTRIDPDFARQQYEKLKAGLAQSFPVAGIREYYGESCWLGVDIDSGPIILNLSPSGTAFAIGSATFFNDSKFRNRLLRTAEIAGHTVKWNDRRHYLLADIALVGEAIALAMRTNHP
ncbi:MAG: hypothetical protein HDS72_03885 [Bacteroidales bacterium]|nr:hypothetical protein [Bacteroidales bacterium]